MKIALAQMKMDTDIEKNYQSIDEESKKPDFIVDSIDELRELGEKFFENN